MSTEDKKETKVLEVEKAAEPIEKPKRKKPEPSLTKALSGVERRIAKLNAYRSLLNHKLTMRGTPPDIKKEIEQEFYFWAEDRMLVHMGEYEENRLFTDDEVEALKNLAAKVMVKAQNNPQAPINPPPKPPIRRVPEGPNRNARPHGNLREAMTMGEIRKRDQETGDFLQKLEGMDRDGPEF